MLVTGLFDVTEIFILFIVASVWPRSDNLVKFHTPEQLEGQRGMNTHSLLGRGSSREATDAVDTLLSMLQKDAQGRPPHQVTAAPSEHPAPKSFHWLPWLFVHHSLLVSSAEDTAWNSCVVRTFLEFSENLCFSGSGKCFGKLNVVSQQCNKLGFLIDTPMLKVVTTTTRTKKPHPRSNQTKLSSSLPFTESF